LNSLCPNIFHWLAESNSKEPEVDWHL
jgi:hypothetical protein